MDLSRRTLLLSFGSGMALFACRRHPRRTDAARCVFCGMRIAPDSHWAAGAVRADGSEVSFDTPGCLFRFRDSPRGRGLRSPWVTEYYAPSGRRSDARTLRYVIGSDVVGPMGRDLVPVAPERVEAFLREHHGRDAYTYDAVTTAVLRSM